MYTTQYLKNLKKKIENLDVYHHQKILSIIKKHEIDFSENKNGIFINMNAFTKNLIKDINAFKLQRHKSNKKLAKAMVNWVQEAMSASNNSETATEGSDSSVVYGDLNIAEEEDSIHAGNTCDNGSTSSSSASGKERDADVANKSFWESWW